MAAQGHWLPVWPHCCGHFLSHCCWCCSARALAACVALLSLSLMWQCRGTGHLHSLIDAMLFLLCCHHQHGSAGALAAWVASLSSPSSPSSVLKSSMIQCFCLFWHQPDQNQFFWLSKNGQTVTGPVLTSARGCHMEPNHSCDWFFSKTGRFLLFLFTSTHMLCNSSCTGTHNYIYVLVCNALLMSHFMIHAKTTPPPNHNRDLVFIWSSLQSFCSPATEP